MRVSKKRLKQELETYRKQMQRERTMHGKNLFDIMKRESIHDSEAREIYDLFLDAQCLFQRSMDKIRETVYALKKVSPPACRGSNPRQAVRGGKSQNAHKEGDRI